MSVPHIPFAERLESMIGMPSAEVMQAMPVLKRLAAMRLGDFLEPDRIDIVLQPIGCLGITPNSPLAEAAAAIKWAEANRYVRVEEEGYREGSGFRDGEQRTNEEELERLLEHLDASAEPRKKDLFPGLNFAAVELLARFDDSLGCFETELDRHRARLVAARANGKRLQIAPLAKRIEAARNASSRVIGQVGKMRLRDYLNAFAVLTDQSPEVIEGGKAIENKAPGNLDCSISAIAGHEKRRAQRGVTSWFDGYLISPLACLYDIDPDFSNQLEILQEPDSPDEDRLGWQKINELLKNLGY